MFRKRLICAVVAFVLAFGLGACKKPQGLDEVAENLTTYTMSLVYDGDKTVTADLDVRYVNGFDVGLDNIMFHLYPAAFREGAKFKPMTAKEEQSAYPNGKSYGGITIDGVAVGGAAVETKIEGEDEDILNVPLPNTVRPTETVDVHIDFTLSLPNVRHRFGKIGSTVNLGNFYPQACMYENGKFVTDPYYSIGDPFYSAIANYDVTVETPAGLTVASTGTQTVIDGDTAKVRATAKAVRDFALVIGEFTVKTERVENTDVSYYYATDSDPDTSLRAAVDAVKTFSEKFGKYPYPTYSVVETAFLQGGMEYPELVMISDALSRSVYTDAIVHETAHQWFYGLVGNNQVAYPWLDEALTEYATTLFYGWNPSYEITVDDRIADALGAFTLYCDLYRKSDTSMRAVHEYDDSTEYAQMIYVEGSLMLDTLRHTIGDAAFTAALKEYVLTYSFKIARPDDLIACFERAAKRNLKGFFDSWTCGNVVLTVK